MTKIETLLEKPVWQMTGAEFMELARHTPAPPAEVKPEVKEPQVIAPPCYIHGMKALADFLGCSLATAHRIKASGVIDDAIAQIGRKIIFDQEKVLRLLGRKKKGGRG